MADAGSHSGLLLIVDDEENITSGIRRIAQASLPPGVRIETASTPEEAMKILSAATTPSHALIVLSDFNMGTELTGVDLLSWVQAKYPGAHRFLMSGYSPSEIEAELGHPLEATCLSKPFERGALGKVFEILRSPPGA